jgi:hypothetical protein
MAAKTAATWLNLVRMVVLSASTLSTRACCRIPDPRSSPLRPSCSRNTKTDLTDEVGRLHYSLRFPLSAHFGRSICASERLHFAAQYLSTSRRPDYR